MVPVPVRYLLPTEKQSSRDDRLSRGRQILVTVRCPNTGRQLEDIDLYCHDHETLAALRRAIYGRLKASPATVRLELVLAGSGEVLEVADDRRILAKLGFRDKAVITAKLSQVPTSKIKQPMKPVFWIRFISISEKKIRLLLYILFLFPC